MSLIPLCDISNTQADLILDKLHMKAPMHYNVEERIVLLSCSAVFQKYLSGYDKEMILVKFDSKGGFVDFETSDEVIEGIFHRLQDNKKLYPCVVCAGEVTDVRDKSGFGLHCSGCENFFHNSCNEKPIAVQLYDLLNGSPNFIKTFCPDCNKAMKGVNVKLKQLNKNVLNLTSKVEECSKKATEMKSYEELYSSKVKKNSSDDNSMAAKLTKQIAAQQKALKVEETEERNKKTLLVRKPMDNNITNSKTLRSSFNKEFPGIVIKNCRVTAGGSFKIELDNEDDVKKVSSQWRSDAFGGNKGVASPMDMQTSGIIKHVYVDESEEEIESELKTTYPSISKVELFKKNGSFTGTIKVIFKSRKDMTDVVEERIRIFNQRYLMEEFKPHPRVIKCNRCQAFGHIARRCKATSPVCGKCGENSHETVDCSSSARKCTHCAEGHETGNKSCKIMIEKLAEIKQRYQYGF